MRPLIGITTGFEAAEHNATRMRVVLNSAYADAIYAAGGVPFPIAAPPAFERADAADHAALLDDILQRCDGLLFSGGPDLDPKHYGQAPHARTEVLHPRRDGFDIALFRHAAGRNAPALSICLGCQIANVACGGALVQHVDDLKREGALEHYKPDHSSAYHDVSVVDDTLMARITGSRRFRVNSRHHQLVDRSAIGDGLRIAAIAPDGVIEAIEDPRRRFFVAVQWHPEDMIDQPEHLALFRALVDAARRG
ncbi:MAG: gamma-glutamyl-gamma-aminobutyrate hydrolase family protein [Phycisphaerae bacterium]|nr:gamma-glutamyl-gamma-aminobutyrate hydrolase family protein [Phycisphaerae bacterium]